VPKTTKLAFGFEILASKISYKKCVRKMLMQLTPEKGREEVENKAKRG